MNIIYVTYTTYVDVRYGTEYSVVVYGSNILLYTFLFMWQPHTASLKYGIAEKENFGTGVEKNNQRNGNGM